MILFLLCLLLANSPAAAQRNTIWVDGSSQTSRGWGSLKQSMGWRGYEFNDLKETSSQYAAMVGGALSLSDYIGGRIDMHQAENVLGIAHGFGGISLRYAQHENPGIEAMILCGVPNQGSAAMRYATVSSDDQTALLQMVEATESIIGGDNCRDCGLVNLFKGWAESLERDFLSDVNDDSDVIANINQEGMLPTVPYLVLYGTVNDFALSRMLDSRSWLDDEPRLSKCYSDRIEEERKRLNTNAINALIRNNGNFFANALRYIGSVVLAAANPTPDMIASGLATLISGERDAIIQSIQSELESELELARMLRCQLSVQVLEAQWHLAMLDGDFEATGQFWVNTATQQDIEECIEDCDLEFPQDIDPNSHHHCLTYCNHHLSGSWTPLYTFTAEGTNGLLRASEQQLDGPFLASPAIHLPNTNHFQQTYGGHTVLVEAFESIFQGNMGAAFIVPN